MKPVRLGGDAEAELTAAADWYEAQRPGLKAEFVAAVRRVLEQVSLLPPSGFPMKTRGPAVVRRVPVPKFPFVIIYVDDEATAVVIAVAHTSRKPGYWMRRVALRRS